MLSGLWGVACALVNGFRGVYLKEERDRSRMGAKRHSVHVLVCLVFNQRIAPATSPQKHARLYAP